MNGAVDLFVERVRQSRAARQAKLDAAPGTLPTAESRLGLPHVAGARVFDTVTGLEGEVIGGTRENIVVPAGR